MSRRTHTRTRRGMTLVEVLAVVVILGLLAGTLAIGFSGAFRVFQDSPKTGTWTRGMLRATPLAVRVMKAWMCPGEGRYWAR